MKINFEKLFQESGIAWPAGRICKKCLGDESLTVTHREAGVVFLRCEHNRTGGVFVIQGGRWELHPGVDACSWNEFVVHRVAGIDLMLSRIRAGGADTPPAP